MSIRQAIVITAVLVGIWIAGAAGGLDEKSFESLRYFLYVTPPAPQ